MTVAEAGANIAFIKYWGNRPEGGNLPLNASISMTLADCVTRTAVSISPTAAEDEIFLDGRAPGEKARMRMVRFLDRVREIAGRTERASVHSTNSFPTGCGIASSASGFAALAIAASAEYMLRLGASDLSRLARQGSGSAARSIFGGFAMLRPGATDQEAFAEQIAPETHWPELRDLILVLSSEEKAVSSAEGHRLAHTSEMFSARLGALPERIERVRSAILRRDLELLGEAIEEEALSMHAVMMTSHPPLLYWSAGTLEAIRTVWALRRAGLPAYFTIDAGPNVHIITVERHAQTVREAMVGELRCRVIADRPGPAARIVSGASGPI